MCLTRVPSLHLSFMRQSSFFCSAQGNSLESAQAAANVSRGRRVTLSAQCAAETSGECSEQQSIYAECEQNRLKLANQARQLWGWHILLSRQIYPASLCCTCAVLDSTIPCLSTCLIAVNEASPFCIRCSTG